MVVCSKAKLPVVSKTNPVSTYKTKQVIREMTGNMVLSEISKRMPKVGAKQIVNYRRNPKVLCNLLI